MLLRLRGARWHEPSLRHSLRRRPATDLSGRATRAPWAAETRARLTSIHDRIVRTITPEPFRSSLHRGSSPRMRMAGRAVQIRRRSPFDSYRRLVPAPARLSEIIPIRRGLRGSNGGSQFFRCLAQELSRHLRRLKGQPGDGSRDRDRRDSGAVLSDDRCPHAAHL